MNRKEFLKASVGLPLAAAARSLTGPAPREPRQSEGARQKAASDHDAQSRKPNVVVLMSDQHRPDLMTCAGRDLVPTPNLDRIAARGVRFERAYCPYPVCTPSRMSFLTGLHAHHHGVLGNNTDKPLDWRQRTVGHLFRDHAYFTALIGKMHFGDGQTHGFEYRLGFNDWLMHLGPKVRHYADEIASYPGYEKTVHDTGSGFPAVQGLWDGRSPWVGHVTPRTQVASVLEAEDHFDYFVARESSKFIRRYKDQPFFLIAGFLKPHAPFFPPREFAERYPADAMTLPQPGDLSKYPRHIREAAAAFASMGEPQLRRIRAGYLGNLSFVDTCIGLVYDTLEQEGLLDNTIVVYTSDHGEMCGEHGLFQKFVFFEPSVAVPLIVSYPAVLPTGKVSAALAEYMGVYPTLAELAGLPVPQGLDTRSLTPWLRQPDAPGPEAAFAEYALSWAPRFMIRTDRYKYNFNDGDIPELYDLEADPGEMANRAEDPALQKVRRRLHDQLVAWYDPLANPYRPGRLRGRHDRRAYTG